MPVNSSESVNKDNLQELYKQWKQTKLSYISNRLSEKDVENALIETRKQHLQPK